LLPFTVLSLGLAIWMNIVNSNFACNAFLGLFGSGALTTISSIIGYRVERRFELERFYVDARKTLKNLTQYSRDMGIDEKLDFLMNFYNFEQSDIDVSFGRLYFFLSNKAHHEYIYAKIYNPISKVKSCINSHYWHFRWHKDGSGKNENVMRIFIDEIESLLFDVKEEQIGITHCTSIENKFANAIYYELSNKYYILMYGKKTYRKNGGKE